MTSNQINYYKAREEARANSAKEALTKESNTIQRESNAILSKQADIAEQNANTNALNATTSLLQARTRERELEETVRANLANEALKSQSILYDYNVKMAQAAETQRHNLAYEQETEAHNKRVELETVRSNVANERLTERGQEVTKEGQRANVFNTLLNVVTKLAPAIPFF